MLLWFNKSDSDDSEDEYLLDITEPDFSVFEISSETIGSDFGSFITKEKNNCTPKSYHVKKNTYL